VSCNICSQLCAKSLGSFFHAPSLPSASFAHPRLSFQRPQISVLPARKLSHEISIYFSPHLCAARGVVNYLLSAFWLSALSTTTNNFINASRDGAGRLGERERGHQLLVDLFSLQSPVLAQHNFRSESGESPRAPGIVPAENACIRPVIIICGTQTLVSKTFSVICCHGDFWLHKRAFQLR